MNWYDSTNCLVKYFSISVPVNTHCGWDNITAIYRRHLHILFRLWNLYNLNLNFTKICSHWSILGSMMSHKRVIVGLGQSAPVVGWGSPLHAWLATVNWIGCARYLSNGRGYRYGTRGMHYHILLRQYSQNYYTYNSVVKNTYSPCHKDACIQLLIENTEWLLRYTGIS